MCPHSCSLMKFLLFFQLDSPIKMYNPNEIPPGKFPA
nr:MAG TPA: hypothetical protein [Bacteriophage sp.]